MKNHSLIKQLLMEILYFIKSFLARFYFEKLNTRMYSITPSLCVHSVKKEIMILWGKWAFVIWYGRF